MKLAHKIISAVLVGVMSLTFLTACGGMTQAELEQYIKEKGYVTREEAQSIAAQNSGTTIINQTTESQDLVTAINAALKEKGSSITIKDGGSELKSCAQKYADVQMQSAQYTNVNDFYAALKEVLGDDKVAMVTASETTAGRADDIAELILMYQKEGKTITAIGYVTVSYGSQNSAMNVGVANRGLYVVASYETVA